MKEKYSINEVFELIGKDNLSQSTVNRREDVIVDGYKVRCGSLRYMTFYQKGTKCVNCGREGTYFKLESDEPESNRRHFNLYSEDNVMMTKDHIIPKSKDGKDNIDNMQTMCAICNEKKGNKIDDK